MGELRIANWDKYQSKRKDRDSTPWIKFHRRALMSPTWHQMVDSERGQFLALLLLADADGVLATDDPTILQRMGGMSEPIDVQRLISLGLLDGNHLATRRQPNVTPEKEVEVEVEVEKERKNGAKAPDLTPRGVLREVLDDERTDAVIESRKRIRAPLTAHAAKQLAKTLAKHSDPNAAADEMVERGWRTIKPGWGSGAGPPKNRTQLATEQFLAEFSDGNDRQTRSGEVGSVVRGELSKPASQS